MHDLYFLLFILINIKYNLSLINKNLYQCNTTIQKCGCPLNSPIFSKTARIIGGEKVTIYRSWPWMVSIRKWGHHICGGTIISSLFILTAAHCIPSTGLSIAIGIIQQSNLTNNDNRIRAITKVYIHSNWNAEKMHNDLAILRLEHSLNNKYLNKICLPSKFDELSINSEVIAIGFGHEKESSTRSSDNLRQIKLRILSQTSPTCKDELTDPSTQICAGLEISNKG
jgi:secreted trypsin-like serine protease